MISTKKVIIVSAFLAMVGFSASSLVVCAGIKDNTRFKSQAAWVFKARDLQGLVKEADIIMVADAGMTFASRMAYSDNGLEELPYQIVELTVVNPLKGIQFGPPVLVERAGGIYSDGTTVNIDADGGDFMTGEQCLLFLKRQENGGGFYYILNDQARYSIRNNYLFGLDPDEAVTSQLHGKTLSDATTIISNLLR